MDEQRFVDDLKSQYPMLSSYFSDEEIYKANAPRFPQYNLPSFDNSIFAKEILPQAPRVNELIEATGDSGFLGMGGERALPKWVQGAINNSLTGYAHDILYGREPYDLTEWENNHTMLEGLASEILGFFMPLDLLVNMVGAGVGSKIATAGLKGKAVKKLTKVLKDGGINPGDASKVADKIVKREMLQKGFAKEGIEFAGERILDAPGMSHAVAKRALSASLGFSSYGASLSAAQQLAEKGKIDPWEVAETAIESAATGLVVGTGGALAKAGRGSENAILRLASSRPVEIGAEAAVINARSIFKGEMTQEDWLHTAAVVGGIKGVNKLAGAIFRSHAERKAELAREKAELDRKRENIVEMEKNALETKDRDIQRKVKDLTEGEKAEIDAQRADVELRMKESSLSGEHMKIIDKLQKGLPTNWKSNGKEMRVLMEEAIKVRDFLEKKYDGKPENMTKADREAFELTNNIIDIMLQSKTKIGTEGGEDVKINYKPTIYDTLELLNKSDKELSKIYKKHFPDKDVPMKQGFGFSQEPRPDRASMVNELLDIEAAPKRKPTAKIAKEEEFTFVNPKLKEAIKGADYKATRERIKATAEREGSTSHDKAKLVLADKVNNTKYLTNVDKNMLMLAVDNLKTGQKAATINSYIDALDKYSQWLVNNRGKKGIHQHSIENDLPAYIEFMKGNLGKTVKGIKVPSGWKDANIVSALRTFLPQNLTKAGKDWIFEATGLKPEKGIAGEKPQTFAKPENLKSVETKLEYKEIGYRDSDNISLSKSGKITTKTPVYTGLVAKTLYNMAFRFGLRPAELSDIRWEDINLKNKTITLYADKSKRTGIVGRELLTESQRKQLIKRTITIPEETFKLLVRLQKQQQAKGSIKGSIFKLSNNSEASATKRKLHVDKILDKVIKDLDLQFEKVEGKRFTPMSFRRSLITAVAERFGKDSNEYKLVYETITSHKPQTAEAAYNMAIKGTSGAWKNVQDFLSGKDVKAGEPAVAKSTTVKGGKTTGETAVLSGEGIKVGGETKTGKIEFIKNNSKRNINKKDVERELSHSETSTEFIENMSESELREFSSKIDKVISDTKVSPEQIKRLDNAKKLARTTKLKYNIPDSEHKKILLELNLLDVDGKPTINAAKSVKNISDYIDRALAYRDNIQAPTRSTIVDWIAESNNMKGFTGASDLYRGVNPVTEVLRKYGGKFGKELARRMDDHVLYEMSYFGKGDIALLNMEKIVGKKNLDYLFMKDSHLKGYGETSTKAQAFFKSSEYKRANNILKKYTDFIWDEAKKIAKKNMNEAEYSEWSSKFNEKYIYDYFTRSLTKEAKDLIINNENAKAKVISTILEDIVEQKTATMRKKINTLDSKIKTEVNSRARSKMIAERNRLESDVINLSEEIRTTEKWRNEAGALLDSKLRYNPSKITSKNLELERGINLPLYLESADGKVVKTYNTNFQETLGRYIKNQSKFLATARIFPEFTDFSGKHTYQSKMAARKWLTSKEPNQKFIEYARKALYEQVMSEKDILNDGVEGALRKYVAISATGGLSSPMSGVKNIILGSIFDFSVYGGRAFTKGWMGTFSRQNWLRAREIGGLELSTKHLEQAGVHKSIQKYVSGMTPSEYANRVRAMVAGRVVAEEAVRMIRGERNYIFMKGMRENDAMFKLRKTFKLTEDEMRFVKKHGLEESNISTKEPGYAEILDKQRFINLKIDNNAHASTQGLTTVPNLPLWAQNKMAKPLLLFYRMAYVASHNIKNNILAPASYGNFLPMIRYAGANVFGGYLLWELYDKMLGMQKPGKDDFEDYAASAIRAEFLGAGTNIFNPQGGSLFGGFEPVIYRNFMSLQNDLLSMITGKKTIGQGVDDIASNNLVLWNHAKRGYNNYTNKYITDYKRVKTLERSFLEDLGKATSSYRNGLNLIERSPFYRDIRQSFLREDIDRAAERYWAAYYFIVDDEIDNGAYAEVEDPVFREILARKDAKKALKASIHSYRPLRFSDSSVKGRMYRKRFKERYKDRPEYIEMFKETEQKHRTLERLFWQKVLELDRQYRYSTVFGKRGQYKNIP